MLKKQYREYETESIFELSFRGRSDRAIVDFTVSLGYSPAPSQLVHFLIRQTLSADPLAQEVRSDLRAIGPDHFRNWFSK